LSSIYYKNIMNSLLASFFLLFADTTVGYWNFIYSTYSIYRLRSITTYHVISFLSFLIKYSTYVIRRKKKKNRTLTLIRSSWKFMSIFDINMYMNRIEKEYVQSFHARVNFSSIERAKEEEKRAKKWSILKKKND